VTELTLMSRNALNYQILKMNSDLVALKTGEKEETKVVATRMEVASTEEVAEATATEIMVATKAEVAVDSEEVEAETEVATTTEVAIKAEVDTITEVVIKAEEVAEEATVTETIITIVMKDQTGPDLLQTEMEEAEAVVDTSQEVAEVEIEELTEETSDTHSESSLLTNKQMCA